MASAQGGGGSNNDLSCVYRAVDEGASAEQVRAILAGGPHTRRAKQQWLAAVLEYKGGANSDETPLQAAHRRRDGPVVGALLEHGADTAAIGPHANALAICIAYGQVDGLRVLLRSGKHSADEKLAYRTWATVDGVGEPRCSCRPVHLCVVPPLLSPSDPYPPHLQLECLNVLVREFGAYVNKQSEPERQTPLHWLRSVASVDERRAFDALASLGAELNAPDNWGATYIFYVRDPEVLQRMLAHGASPNVTAGGDTPLIRACVHQREAIAAALLPVTSTATRRSVLSHSDYSAIDGLLFYRNAHRVPWKRPLVEELLSSRVSVHPNNAAVALPFAARLAERRWAEAAAHANDPPPWQVHEAMVGLAFDFQEVREVDEAVRVRERRVQELDEELRRRGEEGEEESEGGGDEQKGGRSGAR
jgi:hypothetical protein